MPFGIAAFYSRESAPATHSRPIGDGGALSGWQRDRDERARGRVQRVVMSLDPDLDHARIELQRIVPQKCVFKGAFIGPNPR